jgi:hypothetical protein
VSKKGVAIEGQYFIDLSIPLAPQFVSDAVSGTENLSLHTTSGAVTADVWVTGKNKPQCGVSMKLCSDNGHVHAKVVRLPLCIVQDFSKTKTNPQHDAFSDGESEHRLSLNIDLRANYGDISLSLPRYFRGPITIRSSHERVAFSPALEERMAPLSDVEGVRMYFVGNRPRSGRWRGDVDDDDQESEEDTSAGGLPEEPLDELSVGGRHTSVRIQCHGEPELPPMQPNGWENFCMGTVRFFTSGRLY